MDWSDIEASSNNRGNSSQENEIRDFTTGNETLRQDRLVESMEVSRMKQV